MKKVLLTILLLSVFGLVACSSGNNPEEPVIPVNNDPPVIAASLKRSEYVVGYSFDPAKEVIASAVDNSGNAIGVTVTVKVNGADAELNKCVLETAGDDYEFTVSAKDAADRTKTEKLSFTVQADTVAPEIAVAGGTVLPAGTVISVNSLAAVTDNSGNITDSSCKITYFDGTEQDIMSGSLHIRISPKIRFPAQTGKHHFITDPFASSCRKSSESEIIRSTPTRVLQFWCGSIRIAHRFKEQIKVFCSRQTPSPRTEIFLLLEAI